ncbi:MAG TPA: DUF488 domain-containing protein [Gemmatimonadaceae bacterium]|nr:DUF488 domain-containing protein [Gemmatimonadaceae bacterium]
MDPARLFTIGHSTRTLEEFLGLLAREGATHLVDVRAFPTSARYPHFSRPNLERTLIDAGSRYSHLPSLGGRRRGRRDSRNTQWRNASFRAYADYMETREFHEALEDLLILSSLEPTVIMCAEAVPWRCHRLLISDAAVAQGASVLHIMDARTEPHHLTSFARIDDEGRVRYDAATQSELFGAESR